MKRTLSILLTAIMFLVILAPSTYAMDKEDSPTGVKASIEGYGTSADVEKSLKLDINVRPTSNQYISVVNSSIRHDGGQTAHINASTDTKSPVDTLNLRVFLERWSGSRWVTVTYWDVSNRNSNRIIFNNSHSIVNGNNYRARVIHTIQNNGVVETETSVTSFITT